MGLYGAFEARMGVVVDEPGTGGDVVVEKDVVAAGEVQAFVHPKMASAAVAGDDVAHEVGAALGFRLGLLDVGTWAPRMPLHRLYPYRQPLVGTCHLGVAS